MFGYNTKFRVMHGKYVCLDTGMFGCCLEVSSAKTQICTFVYPERIHKQTARVFVQDTE